MLQSDNHDLDQALKDRAGISERQIAEVHDAADWFWRARTWLHLAAGKLSDVLITNYQDRIAHELNDCSAQEWLSRHLAHSETLARFRGNGGSSIASRPSDGEWSPFWRMDPFTCRKDSPYPASATGMFLVAQRYSIPVSLEDLKRLEEDARQALEIQEPSGEEVWAFNQILGESQGIASTLRALSEFGILDRFIPNYSEVMRFVPPDPAHRHTVGEHSMRMVEHLESLRAGRDPAGQRFYGPARPVPAFRYAVPGCIASRCRETGPGKDHCSAGAELAKSVSARLNLAPEKREILDVLVRQHLLLVRTARLHDLKSAHVIRKAAEQVPSLEALRHLYVFTYVDTCAVAENNWTSMDLRDLEDLYRKMQDYCHTPLRRSSRPRTDRRIGASRSEKNWPRSRPGMKPPF